MAFHWQPRIAMVLDLVSASQLFGCTPCHFEPPPARFAGPSSCLTGREATGLAQGVSVRPREICAAGEVVGRAVAPADDLPQLGVLQRTPSSNYQLVRELAGDTWVF
jgi:hypothetical protein